MGFGEHVRLFGKVFFTETASWRELQLGEKVIQALLLVVFVVLVAPVGIYAFMFFNGDLSKDKVVWEEGLDVWATPAPTQAGRALFDVRIRISRLVEPTKDAHVMAVHITKATVRLAGGPLSTYSGGPLPWGSEIIGNQGSDEDIKFTASGSNPRDSAGTIHVEYVYALPSGGGFVNQTATYDKSFNLQAQK